jgi:hypothetical protein
VTDLLSASNSAELLPNVELAPPITLSQPAGSDAADDDDDDVLYDPEDDLLPPPKPIDGGSVGLPTTTLAVIG